MSQFRSTIAAELPGLPDSTYERIEYIIQQDVFQRPLSGCSPAELKQGAREALLILNEQAVVSREEIAL